MENRKKQEGYLLVIVALVITVFLGFVALSVDAGILYSSRTAAQRAADAAALAGAFAFVTRPDLTDTEAGRSAIKQYAIGAAAQNKIFGTSVVITEPDVDVDFTNRRVTTRVNHTQNTFFARVLGSNNTNIFATAVAEAVRNATGDSCTKPWFIPNTVLSDNNGNNALCNACTEGELLIDVANHTITQYARDWMTAQDLLPLNNNPPPRQFTIKPQNPAGSIAPGQFFAIRLGNSTGGNDYETNIKNCPADPIYCASSYPSEPGNMIGPTRQGVYTLIDYNRDPNCNNACITDTYEGVGRYRRPGSPHSDGGLGSTSRSLILAPIIDVCVFCPDNFPSGTESGQYVVVGFALIFLEGIQGNDVKARLISLTACSAGGGGGGQINPLETGPFGQPVRLVRLPPSP